MKTFYIVLIVVFTLSPLYAQVDHIHTVERRLGIGSWDANGDFRGCYILKIKINPSKQIKKVEVYSYNRYDSMIAREIKTDLSNYPLTGFVKDTSLIFRKEGEQTILAVYIYKRTTYTEPASMKYSCASYPFELSELEKILKLLKYVNNLDSGTYTISKPLFIRMGPYYY